MLAVRSPRTRALLLSSAAAAVVALTSPASAGVIIRNIQPAPQPATAATAAPASLSSSSTIALPLQSPPINGFQPHVVFGLTNEAMNDFVTQPSYGPPISSALPVPNPPRYFIGTFDTGATVSIIGAADAAAIDLYAHGLEGTYSIEVAGAGGPENTEQLDVSDALGLYITGLGNATASTSGPSVPTSTLQGLWNNSLLTARSGSVIPNLIGAPMTAYHQVRMFNSQTQRLQFNGKTYQGPHVTMRELGAPGTEIDSSFVQTELTPVYPGGANTVPVYVPDFFSSDRWNDNPTQPTVYNGLIAKVDVTHSGGTLVEREFLFDTGAQVTLLSTSVANGVGISTGGSNPTPVDFTVEVLGIGGIKTVNGYYIQKLKLVTSGGPMEWTNVPVLVDDLPDTRDGVGFIPGILGMNLFNDRDLIVNADLDNPFFAFSQTPFQPAWIGNAGGNWGDNSKWMLGVPWEPGAPANFTAATAAPQTINVEADYTLGTMKLDNANRYTIQGPGTLRFEGIISSAAIQVDNGSHTIAAPVQLASNTQIGVIPAASVLTISNDVTSPNNSAVAKTGQGTLEMKRMLGVGAVDVQAGKLKMLSGSGGAAGTSSIDTLSIAADARLDLTNNNLVIRNGDAGDASGGVYDGVQGDVQRAYNFTSWDQPGLTTSMADARTGLTTIGVATGAQMRGLGASETGLWSGQTITGASVIAMYTYAGDANLDGQIDAGDYGIIDNFVQIAGASGYASGDFNYDGFIDAGDYGIIDNNVQAQNAPFPTSGSSAALSSVSAVPEPSALGLALLAAAALGTRRRRV